MMSFELALAKHLESVRDRDLETLIKTITSGQRLSLVMPDGNFKETRDEFIAFHKAWFEDMDWRLEHEVVSVQEGEASAFALIKTLYKDIDQNGKAYEMRMLVGLGFVKELDEWRLTHDQNTVAKG